MFTSYVHCLSSFRPKFVLQYVLHDILYLFSTLHSNPQNCNYLCFFTHAPYYCGVSGSTILFHIACIVSAHSSSCNMFYMIFCIYSVHYNQILRTVIISVFLTMRRITVACPALPYFSTLSHTNGAIFGEKIIEPEMCVLVFSTTPV